MTNNALDYEQSQGIITLLQKMENVSVADFPVLEEELVPEQAWRPYRIEHFVAESGRSSYSGTFSGVGLFSFSGTSKGNSIGKSVPNILESSSIVFLTDGEQTLRVLIPSPEAMKELITRHLEACVEDKPDGTFVKGMVQRYAFNDAKLRMGLTNPSAIDKLDVSLESPMDARPTVRVCGQLLQPGVVLGTQLQISDKKMLLLPSGFLREFSETTQGLLETKKAPILLPEAIGA
ncbi:hypothetical protein HQ571_02100 [Candidatus Kuenenbacteria bacterium]|nr:hypothetical protein [Candidatus Kuenenbacteria bacterium]